MIQLSSPHGEQEGIPRLWSIIRERRKAVLLCMIASFAIAAIGYARVPTKYTSEAILALDVRKLQALPTESVMSPLPQESPVLRTELDIIGSQSMAQRVLASLQDGPQGKFDRVRDSALLNSGETQAKVIDELMRNVRVVNDGRSYTIYISYAAGDPVYAAKIANAFGQAYIDYQIDLQTTATRRVSDWLRERLGSLRSKLEESERQASEFREKSGLIDSGGIPLLSQRLAGLNAELTSLQTRLAGSKARLATAIEVQQGGDSLGLMEVLSSPTVQLLRTEQARAVRAIGEIDESGARMNPQLSQLKSQVSSLKQQIDQEVSQIIDSLRNEIEVNGKQQREVERDFKAVQRAITNTNMATVQSAQLDREAAANRSIYETYLARYKQTLEQDGIATAEARIISRAMPSTKPTSPDKFLWALVGLLLGCGSSFAAALILHLTDTSVGAISALPQKTGLAVIGQIPRMAAAEIRNGPELPGGKAADFYSSLADLQTYIELDQNSSKVITFTSSAEREGKTFVIANLARSLALSGVKVIVVDANLRQPGLGTEFNIQASRHLGRAIAGELSFDELIQRDYVSSVDVIAAKADDTPPNLILGSKRFSSLLQELRKRYELVLVEAPPASYDLDLLRITMLSDATVLVVRPGLASKAGLQNAITKLNMTGKHVTGMVINGVRRQKRRRGSRWSWRKFFQSGKPNKARGLMPVPVTSRR